VCVCVWCVRACICVYVCDANVRAYVYVHACIWIAQATNLVSNNSYVFPLIHPAIVHLFLQYMFSPVQLQTYKLLSLVAVALHSLLVYVSLVSSVAHSNEFELKWAPTEHFISNTHARLSMSGTKVQPSYL